MLAPNKMLKPENFTYPMMSSIKMDGIRALIINGALYSRSGKLISSLPIQRRMAPLIEWCAQQRLVLDGELWSFGMTFQKIISIVMSKASVDTDYTMIGFHAFDALTFDEWENHNASLFTTRNLRLFSIPEPGIHVTQLIVQSAESLEHDYKTALDDGYEGLIVRSPTGKYKWGRCTIKENNIFKLKNVEEIDGVVMGYGERMIMMDGCEREQDAFGREKPVNRKEDLVGAGDLGYLTVRDESGRQFNVGSGFTLAERREMWATRGSMIGRWVKIKSATAGVKDLPRHPVFVGFRDFK